MRKIRGYTPLFCISVIFCNFYHQIDISLLGMLSLIYKLDEECTGLGESKQLNTLVLKSNRVSSLGKALAPCTSLTKLSIAHNQLAELGDSLAACHQLAELRVGHNQLSGLPGCLASNTRLKIVEAGGNQIDSVAHIQVNTLTPCHLGALAGLNSRFVFPPSLNYCTI